jgi:glutathione S-transferase
MWLGLRIGPYRRAAKVAHPSVAASTETIANAKSPEEKRALYLFNAAQRAHHNVQENYPSVLTAMLISGLEYPRLAAGLGMIWVIGRIGYAVGYTSTSRENVEGKGRFYYGGFHAAALSQMGLMILVGKMGWNLLQAGS